MEISGKILREVEFRDRLRGYDTDEVDEFLEKVAVGIDEMRTELVQLREQLNSAERRVDDAPPAPDDESIRRTLVLAQRTADLAIKEAREEAGQLLEDARSKSDQLVTQAEDTARRVKEEADFEAHERIDKLADQRDRLERDIQSLAHLLGSERDRLTQALQAALGFVTESLAMSDPMSQAVGTMQNARRDVPTAPTPPVRPSTQASPPQASTTSATPTTLPDVDAEIQEDADTARSFSPPEMGMRHPTEHAISDEEIVDPDEALWARWANGAEVDFGPSRSDVASDTGELRQFPIDRRGGPTA